MNLFAQLDLGRTALEVLRVIAAVGGAFVGWFLSDPLARVAYWLAVQKAIPGWTLPWLKLSSAVLVALLVYYLIPLGGGPGGWGYGPGLGGDPGLGAGAKDAGTAAVDAGKARSDKVKPPEKSPEAVVRKPIEIEVLGGKRYPGDERYYLLRTTGKAMTIGEVEMYFKENGRKLELHVILTDDSPDDVTGVTEALTRLAGRYQIPSLVDRPSQK